MYVKVVIYTGGVNCLLSEVRRVERNSQNAFWRFRMNTLFPPACLLDVEKGVEKGVAILNRCGGICSVPSDGVLSQFGLILVGGSARYDWFRIRKEDKMGDR